MRNMLLLLLIISAQYAPAQKLLSADELSKIAEDIKTEGLLLYTSEQCSWVGTDVFIAGYKGDQGNIGGYCSYVDGSVMKCIFIDVNATDTVLGTVTFKDGISPASAMLNLNKRALTSTEKQYTVLRNIAKQMVETDTFFKRYNGCNANIIPIITNSLREVYILTATKREDVITYGNDYLIKFDDNNRVNTKEALHRSLITMNRLDTSQVVKGAIHTHLPEYSPFMTPTDICTSLLYLEQGAGNSCVTVSENYTSIWNCDAKALVIVPRQKK